MVIYRYTYVIFCVLAVWRWKICINTIFLQNRSYHKVVLSISSEDLA